MELSSPPVSLSLLVPVPFYSEHYASFGINLASLWVLYRRRASQAWRKEKSPLDTGTLIEDAHRLDALLGSASMLRS